MGKEVAASSGSLLQQEEPGGGESLAGSSKIPLLSQALEQLGGRQRLHGLGRSSEGEPQPAKP